MEPRESLGKGKIDKKELIVGAIIILLLLSLGIVKIVGGGSQSANSSEIASQGNEGVFVPEGASTIMKVREKIDEEKRAKATAAIADHETAISRDWTAADTPDRYMAIGNLRQYQLNDYNAAIQDYRTLVDSYPDYSKRPQAYLEIAQCYEELGEEEQARHIYREMVQVLDPSSQHVAYAKTRLAGQGGGNNP